MKLTIIMDDFPMDLASQFTAELSKHHEAGVAFMGKGNVTVHMESADIVKIQEVCIICDRYSFRTNMKSSENL